MEYTVTLLEMTKDKESWDLKETADKLAEAGVKKEAGNALFKAGKYERACKKYEKVRAAQGLPRVRYSDRFCPEPSATLLSRWKGPPILGQFTDAAPCIPAIVLIC